MEYVVIFNQGRDAARAGQFREAPASIMYPIVNRYEPFHRVEASLSKSQQREWLRGFDSVA